MPTEALEAKFKSIVGVVADVLKTAGFKKSGSRFRREVDGNLQLIEFQRSGFNDRDCLRFTANIGVISARVLQKFEPEAHIQNKTEIDAHLRERLGNFRDKPGDYWWQLSESADDAMIADEIRQLISKRVLPFLMEHSDDDALATLWSSGRSPGLTEFQRNKFLAALS